MQNKSTTEILESAKNVYGEIHVKEFSKPLKDRISHPLIFSFICTFVVINWDFILYLIFSSDIIEAKIDKFYLHHNDFKNLFVKPAFIAIIYVLGFPYISNLINRALVKAKEEDYILQKEALTPEYKYKMEEANKAKALQLLIAENTDIALINKRVAELEDVNKSQEIQFQEQKAILEKTMKELQDQHNIRAALQFEIQKKDTDHENELQRIKLQHGSESNEFNRKFIDIFNKLYDKSRFSPDLFQDNFSFEKAMESNMIEGFISFMKDRMKYFGIFTSEIIPEKFPNGRVKFLVYLNYSDLNKKDATKKSLIKMFEEIELPNI